MSAFSIDRRLEPSRTPASMESSTKRMPPFSFYPPLYVTPPLQQHHPPSPSSLSPSPYVLNFKRRGPVQSSALHSNGNGESHNLLRQQKDSLESTPGADGKKEAEIDASERNPNNEIDASEGNSNAEINVSERNPTETHASDSNPGHSAEFWKEEETSREIGCGNDMAMAGDGSEYMNSMSMARDGSGECSDKITVDRLLGHQVESEVFEMEIMPATQTRPNHALGGGHLGQAQMKMERLHEKEASVGLHHKSWSGTGSEGGRLASSIASTTCDEFFDAPDAPFDDSASEDEACSSNSNPRMPRKSFDKLTPRLQEEIARRIRAEESLASLQLHWNEMTRRCSLIGLSLSLGPIQDVTLEGGRQEEREFSEQFSEKLMVARLVGGAIASAAVRAVKEEELESMLAGKNREISRLWDKLQYVELVNREMSQRNQEAIEIGQRRRRRRRKRQKWAFGCFCAAFCVGSAGLLCCRYFPWEQAKTWTKSLSESPKSDEPVSPELCSA